MTTNPEQSSFTNAASNGESQVNQEWQLAEIVDAIAAEIDRAEDTLSLKSYARGKSLSLHQLSLDLEVTVRRDTDGRILFRTIEPNQTSATVLKLDFSQVLENQLRGVRQQLDKPADRRPLAQIPGIKPEEINALNAIAIYSIDDLERYTQTAAMLAEVSRKTGIEDKRIRQWRQLPFLDVLKPANGPPGSSVLIEGGYFGSLDPNTVVLFQGQPAQITSWSESRIQVKMPSQVSGSGVLFAVIGGQMTNTITWEATTVDLFVRDIFVEPSTPIEEGTITVKADLLNQGSGASGSFEVQWTIDNQPQPMGPHGTLQPNQRSQESSSTLELKNLSAGKHTIRFTADPANKLPDLNQANGTFTKEIIVGALKQLTLGDYRPTDTLDPFRIANLGVADTLSLIFRGLVRLDPKTGEFKTDVARNWTVSMVDEDAVAIAARKPPGDIDDSPFPIRRVQQVIFRLFENVRFHDGTLLTADDVAFTYQMLKKSKSPLQDIAGAITDITVYDKWTIGFRLYRGRVFNSLSKLWTLGTVPQVAYQANPDKFGLNPIGSGPFQVKSFVPGEEVQLLAFRDYVQGTPRLDRLRIRMVKDADQLLNLVLAGDEIKAAVLPYSEPLYSKVRSSGGELTIVQVPESQPTLLHVQQSKGIYERLPNAYDSNWNAHLWYTQK